MTENKDYTSMGDDYCPTCKYKIEAEIKATGDYDFQNKAEKRNKELKAKR